MTNDYIPDRGDIIKVNFDPQAGHEQKGTRAAFVITQKKYNSAVGLAVVCPITNKIKGFPFEVLLPEGLSIKGVILADHVKSLDWKARKAEFITKAPQSVTHDTLNIISLLFK
jgi:mRNA interferase MazF